MQFVDFDGVRFHMSTAEGAKKTQLLLSMNIRCWDELVQYGAREELAKEYGSYLQSAAEPGYHVSLLYDLDAIKAESPGQSTVFL